MLLDELAFGGYMTLWGMGSVFVLLAMLLGVLKLIGWFDQYTMQRAAEKTAAVQAAAVAVGTDAAVTDEEVAPAATWTPDEVSAITVAVLAELGQLTPAALERSYQPGSQLFASRWVAIGRSYQHQPWSRK